MLIDFTVFWLQYSTSNFGNRHYVSLSHFVKRCVRTERTQSYGITGCSSPFSLEVLLVYRTNFLVLYGSFKTISDFNQKKQTVSQIFIQISSIAKKPLLLFLNCSWIFSERDRQMILLKVGLLTLCLKRYS